MSFEDKREYATVQHIENNRKVRRFTGKRALKEGADRQRREKKSTKRKGECMQQNLLSAQSSREKQIQAKAESSRLRRKKPKQQTEEAKTAGESRDTIGCTGWYSPGAAKEEESETSFSVQMYVHPVSSWRETCSHVGVHTRTHTHTRSVDTCSARKTRIPRVRCYWYCTVWREGEGFKFS